MKKLIYLISLIIIVCGVFIAINQYRFNKNMPASVSQKLSFARNNIIMNKNVNDVYRYYEAAYKQSKNSIVLEEYLTFLVSQENLNKSYKVAKQILKTNPNHFLANLVATVYYIRKDKLDVAINNLKASSTSNTSLNSVIFSILSGINAFVEGDTKKFDIIYSPIKQQVPDFYYNQVVLYNLLTKDYKNALLSAKEASNLYPSIGNIIIYSALLFKDNEKDGIRSFEDYLGDNFLTDDSVRNYLKAISSKNINLQYVVSDAIFRIAEKSSSDYRASYIEPDSILMTHLALMLSEENNIARISLANFYENIDSYKSLKNYSKVNRESFYYYLVYNHVATLYSDLKQSKKEYSVLNSVRSFDKSNPKPLLEIGHYYHKQKKYAEAIKYYSNALDLANKNDNKLAKWIALYFRGISYNDNNDWKDAEKDLVMALNINADDPLLLNYLGYSWLEKNYNVSKAILLINKAYSINPSNPNILDSYAWSLFKQKRYQEALTISEEAKNKIPYDPLINSHLGDIYWQLGNKDAAFNSWKSALNMNPDSNLEKDVKAKISGSLPEYLDKNISPSLENKSNLSLAH